MIEETKNKEYYEVRMNHLINMFKDHEGNLINKNKEKVVKLTSEYKLKFINKPNYNGESVSLIENLILN